MNKEELMQWQDAVLEHCKMKTTLVADKKDIEDLMKEHLSQYFDWDVIVFDKDFNTIKLLWKYGIEPIIKIRTIRNLGIDFIMGNEYHKELGQCNSITLYPFGLPEEGVITES